MAPVVDLHNQLTTACGQKTPADEIMKEFAEYGSMESSVPNIIHSDGTEEKRTVDFSKINWGKFEEDQK